MLLFCLGGPPLINRSDNWMTASTGQAKRVGYVAIGTFYFGPGASIVQRYEIVAIDGDGNISPSVAVAR